MKKKNHKITLSAVLAVLFAFVTLVSCGKKKFELTFVTDGGTEISNAQVEEGAEYELPQDVTRDGYAFDGWYDNSSFNGEKLTTVKASDNATYYAKWVKLFTITLKANGSQKTISAKEGETIANAVKDENPTKSGLIFGAWFLNGVELAPTIKVTKDVTLEAKFKAQYKVNVFKENLTQDGYDKEELTNSAYVGSNISADVDLEGFTLEDNENNALEKTVSENENNDLTVYLKREQYKVVLRSNYPNGKTEETLSLNVKYGEEKELPETSFQCDGYYLKGFAASPNGEIVYQTNFLENNVINVENKEIEAELITATKNLSLYGIWVKAYTDMFGGNDYIYVDDKDAYLSRDGVYFKGEFDSKKNVYLNGEDVSKEIRSKEVTDIVSQVSSIVEVRAIMVEQQRELAKGHSVIMEGRDITTVVFPNADYKFYLDASVEERVKRRVLQNEEAGLESDYEEINKNIEMRDYNDINKEVGALKRTDEQIYIDSTNMSIDEVINFIIEKVGESK